MLLKAQAAINTSWINGDIAWKADEAVSRVSLATESHSYLY